MKERVQTEDFNLKAGAHIHLMGICGTAMASLAGLLIDRGFRVTGSDQNVYPPMSTQLENLGIKIMEGYKKENLAERPDLVVVGNVITRKHEESIALMESDIPFTSLPRVMGELIIENRNSVVISGTHGKTTTTSMAAWVCQGCDLKPGFLVGGIPQNFGLSFKKPDGDWFVIEGDEYDTAFFDKVPKFIHYKPKTVVFTSCEFDHADIYDSMEDIRKAFFMLVERVHPEGVFIFNGDDQEVSSIASKYSGKKISYGLGTDCDYRATNIEVEEGVGTRFTVEIKGVKHEVPLQIFIPMFGDYNVLNALSVFVVGDFYEWPEDKMLAAFSSFKGIKRRQELLGTPGGVRVIEDFAHHPTAVRKTINGVRAQFSSGKLFAIFEPRSATSRRKIFQREYEEAFGNADVSIVAKPFDQSRIPEDERLSTEDLVQGISRNGHTALIGEGADDIVSKVAERAQPGDTVLIMSNGGFDGIYQKMLARLEK